MSVSDTCVAGVIIDVIVVTCSMCVIMNQFCVVLRVVNVSMLSTCKYDHNGIISHDYGRPM